MDHEDRGERTPGTDFIRAIVARHQEDGTYGGRVETRFPPEPNGYLHIGHAKSIVLNFGLAAENGGACHLRFDDTNPLTEDMKYVHSIKDSVRWLGYDWGEHFYFASDHFERLYECAEILIEKGKAYVDEQSEEEIREGRGTVTRPGTESPYRYRSPEENLDLFRRMKAGEFEDGTLVLRAKIDMAHPNMIMRDPVLYRIRHAEHYRRGDAWCIYPLYDFTHCLSDAFEDITHSICTLEFENNREIYDWLLEEVGFPEPRTHQYEMARLNLDYTVLSKRKLLRLVEEGHVEGWDEPRMPTIAGLRRRGVPPEAIRSFCEMIGVAKADSRVDIGKLEYSIRDYLNYTAPRVMCVLQPLKVVVTNYPEGQVEELEAPYFPRDVGREGSRAVPFSRELYIERDDFQKEPQKGFYRLAPDGEVRLRYGYFIKCEEVIEDPETGEVVELRCTYDPETRGGSAPGGRKVKGTIHWVSADHSLPAEVRLYDRLFRVPDPEDVADGEDFISSLNPDSKVVLAGCRIEPSVAEDPPGTGYQFERQGYFMPDSEESTPDALVFNRTVTLRDTWAKISAAKADRQVDSAAGEGAGEVGDEAVASPVKEGEEGEARRRRGSPGAEARGGARKKWPELAEMRVRYESELGLGAEDADLLTGSRELASFFEDAIRDHDNPAGVARWVVNELLRELKERPVDELPFAGAELGELIRLVDSGTVSHTAAKNVFQRMLESGVDPREAVESMGLEKVGDLETLIPLVERLLAEHPDKAAEYRGGKSGLMGFFVGQVMRETTGAADPKVVQDLFRERLG